MELNQEWFRICPHSPPVDCYIHQCLVPHLATSVPNPHHGGDVYCHVVVMWLSNRWFEQFQILRWCSGASPWSCDGSRSASVDVFTSLGMKDTTSPNSINYFTTDFRSSATKVFRRLLSPCSWWRKLEIHARKILRIGPRFQGFLLTWSEICSIFFHK